MAEERSSESPKIARMEGAKRVASRPARPRKGGAPPSAGKPAAAAELTAHPPGRKGRATKSKGIAADPKPLVLLAGGTPPIAKADGDAPVPAYIAAMPGWKSDVGRRLDALIVRTVPGVRKAVRWNSPFYGVEGRGWFLGFHCMTRYIKVAFFRGMARRPLPPGESKHKETRYLDIYEEDRLDEELVGSWIRQASELPGWVP